MFPAEQKLVLYITYEVPALAIVALSKEHKTKEDKLKDVLTLKEANVPCQARKTKQRRIPPRWEGLVLVATHTKG